jgi:Cd2+/Zn2+-exporting ATPase
VEKLKVEIRLLVGADIGSADKCAERLVEMLKTKSGIESAHVVVSKTGGQVSLCVHYDPTIVSTADVRDAALKSGAALEAKYGHLLKNVPAMHARRASAIEARLRRVAGVLEGVVSPEGSIRVEFDREQTSASTIEQSLDGWIGDQASVEPVHDHKLADGDEKHEHAHGGLFGERTELMFAILCGALLLVGWLVETFATVANWMPVACYVIAYFFGGYFTVLEAVEKLRSGKFEIDFLMIVAAIGAAILGAWAEGSLLLFLFSIGHALEGYAMGRAKRAIEALAALAPPTARVQREGREVLVAIDQVRVGDVLIIRPDERIPTDGFVIEGESSVDQSAVTGESVPVDKRPVDDPDAVSESESLPQEHRLYAGTINQSGSLTIKATKAASENTLSRVVQLVSEAETRVSPTQQFTKKFESYFVPSVLVGIVLLFFAPLVIDEPFASSFYRAMAVLVAASPCALAISTPSAVLSGVARGARSGVLLKGGGPLERLGSIDAIAFDKTGTLTEGQPKLTDIRPMPSISEEELLRAAISVEQLSNHPLAKAVVRDGVKRLSSESVSRLPTASDLRSVTGKGIQATVEGKLVQIGKETLFESDGSCNLDDSTIAAVQQLKEQGRSTMIVRRDKRYLGVLGLMDTPRESSKRALQKLASLGVRRMIMISGDNQQVASAVAAEVGITEARGDLMPEDKVKAIRQLESEGGVAMVGDGVNDAPAMAAASVGIAMGAAGSDVALETADVALMANNLEHLPLAIGLSRATQSIIRQNLWISLGMVAFLVPATIIGLQIAPAVALHEGSTVIVVFNALRLLAYNEDFPKTKD